MKTENKPSENIQAQIEKKITEEIQKYPNLDKNNAILVFFEMKHFVRLSIPLFLSAYDLLLSPTLIKMNDRGEIISSTKKSLYDTLLPNIAKVVGRSSVDPASEKDEEIDMQVFAAILRYMRLISQR